MDENTQLFTVNKKPMIFDLFGLTSKEMALYKTVIKCGGGVVSDDDTDCLVKFTNKKTYKKTYKKTPGPYTVAAIYDVEFIVKCNEMKVIVDPARYSLGDDKSRDECLMHHFLYGCGTCLRRSETAQVTRDPIDATNEAGNEDISSPSFHLTESAEFFSAENSQLAAPSQSAERLESIVEQNPCERVDESQVVLTNGEGLNYNRACGDTTEPKNDKRPCSFEFLHVVKPKMEKLAEQQRKLNVAKEQRANIEKGLSPRDNANNRRQRSPRTMLKRRRVHIETQEEEEVNPIKIEYETATDIEISEDTSQVHSFTSSPVPIFPKTEKISPLRSTSDLEPSEKAQCPPDGDAVSANNLRNTGHVPDARSVESSPVKITLNPNEECENPRSSSDSETPKKKSRNSTVITETRQRRNSSSYVPKRSKTKENWIVKKNVDRPKTTTDNISNQNNDERNPISLDENLSYVPNPCFRGITENCSVNLRNYEKGYRRNRVMEDGRDLCNVSKNLKESKKKSEIEKREENVSEKRHKRGKNIETDLVNSSGSDVSILSDVESIPEAVARPRITSADESWNKAGPSGVVANKRTQPIHAGHESGKENRSIQRTENSKKSKITGRLNNFVTSSESDEPAAPTLRNGGIKMNGSVQRDTNHSRSKPIPSSSESDSDFEMELKYRDKIKNRQAANNRAKPALATIRHRRVIFSPAEQVTMIEYLIEHDAIRRAKGKNVWKEMIADGYLTHRTFQSLHNHFKMKILPDIDQFENVIDNASMKVFLRLKESRR